MKKIILTAAICGVFSAGAFAQGLITFNSFNSNPAIDAPVLDVNGVALAGTAYMAQLYVAPAGTTEFSALSAVEGATSAFAQQGYFLGGVKTVPGVDFGTVAAFQVRAWATAAGATFEQAMAAGGEHGWSNIFETSTGGPAPNPPGFLAGMDRFQLIPEPSTVALGILGFAALLFRFRRK